MGELMDRQMDLLLLLLCKRSYYPKPLFLPSLGPVEQPLYPFTRLSQAVIHSLEWPSSEHRVYSWLLLS